MVATLLIFVSMLVDVSSTNQNNSFTCFENGCICIPQSYDNLKGPSDNGTILYLDMNNAPENSITTLRKVDQKEFTLSLTWIWMISWIDERLNLTTKNAPFVPVTEAVENKLWTPYLEISPVKSIRKLPELHKQRPGLFIWKRPLWLKDNLSGKTTLTMVQYIDLELHCEMDFYQFPFDTQECQYMVWGALGANIVLKWMNETLPHFKGQNLDYAASISFGHTTVEEVGEVATFTIKLERKYGKDFLEIIGPTSLLVLVSWISFVVPTDAIPGRLTLLLTLFLCMINTLNSAHNNAPRPHEGATALIRWLVMCIVFILLALLEYAFILGCSGFKSMKTESNEKENINGKKNDDAEAQKPPTMNKRFQITSSKLDKISLLILPNFFVFMTILFWTWLYRI